MSTPGTISVDRRLHFSSASTKTPPSVDKSHLQAPCLHARHPLRGQAAAFLFRVHKNTPIRGQMLPTGTVRPHQAPSPWTKVTSRHRASTPGTLYVDRRVHFRIALEDTQTKKASVSRSLFCDPSGARTQDPNIKSVVLYLLS